MSKLVVTLIGLNNEAIQRINVKLDGLPEDVTVLPDVQLIELEIPAVVRGVQINGVPDN